MTPATTRALRRALLLVVAGVTIAVIASLRRPTPTPVKAPGRSADVAPAGTTVDELVLRRFKGEHEGFVLRAKSLSGQEGDEQHAQGVSVDLEYMAQKKPGRASISSRAARFNQASQRVVFEGSVHVVTEDGFELDTESLVYRGDKGVAKTTDPVKFKRKTLSGTATGLEYRSAEGRLELPADVFLEIAGDPGPPTQIRAARAFANRGEGLLRFEQDVDVRQGADSLKAGKLNVNLDDELSAVYRAVALDDAELRANGASGAGQAMGSPKARGPRLLKGRKLDVWFREDRSLQEVTAGPEAELEVMPAKGEAPERKRIKGRVLSFRFDAKGQLSELQARKDVVLSIEPLAARKGLPRTVSANSLLARLEPSTGELQSADLDGDVAFHEGPRRAKGQRAHFEGADNNLLLSGDPQLVDEEQGSDLRAISIAIAHGSGDIVARNDVRHTLQGKAKDGTGGLLMNGRVPTVVTGRTLDYDGRTKTARYGGGALLRQGRDEVRSATIVIEQPQEGQRRLVASGDVISLLNPRNRPGQARTQAAVEGRSQEMVYEEAKSQIFYSGEVTIRQGEISTKSPEATLTLTPEGDAVKTLVAGEPVEVEQGARHATGARGTYTHEDETMVLVGEKVVLREPERDIEGRTLTFHVGDDRILVDGQELVRTETVIRREAKPHPNP